VRSLATVTVLSWSLVAVGGLLRLVRFGDNRSLWLDEAMLSLNVLERGFLELLRPLDHAQAAPPAFLLLVKLSVATIGDSEYALRLVPLLAALAALVIFRRLSARLLPGLPGLVALGLFAVAEPLVHYAAEVKQYSLDVLAVVALLAIAAEPLVTGRLSGRRAVALAVAGLLAVSVSYPSVFLLVGVAAVLALEPFVSRRRLSHAALVLAVVWACSFGAVLVFMLGRTGEVRAAAVGLGEAGVESPLRIAVDVWRAFGYPAPFARTTVGLAVLVAVLGALHLRRRRLPVLAVLAVVVAATATAATANLYPFFGRFVLFLVPLVLLLVGAGVQELRELTRERTRAVWITALLVLAVFPVGVAAANAVSPPGIEETRGVIRAMEERWQPGDLLFAARLAQPALAYYAECEQCEAFVGMPTDDLRRVVLSARTREGMGLRSTGALVAGELDAFAPRDVYLSELGAFRGEPRVWVLFSSGWRRNFASFVLDCVGRRTEAFEAHNAAAYLYDFSRPPTGSDACFPG
jgi:hypothetical protein